MAYQPTPKEAIWEIADYLTSVRQVSGKMFIGEKEIPPEKVIEMGEIVKDHTIEMMMRPPAPGRRRGALKNQLDLWKAFFEQQNKYQIFALSGSNQAGKTLAAAVCVCKFIRDDAKDGDVLWVIAQSYTTLKDVPLKEIYSLLPKGMFPEGRQAYDPSVHEIPPMKLKLPGNRGHCEVWFKSEDQGILKFESSRLRGIWWTECASQALYDALLPRLIARGGFMIMDYIAFYGWHRTVLREKSSQPNSPIWWRKFIIMDNAHNLPDGSIGKMKATMSTKMWEIRGLGKEAAAQGVVYQNFDPEIHCCPAFKIPDWWPLYMAADWGFNAPHCFGLFTVSPNETIYLVAEHYESQMGVMDTVQAVWEMVNSIRKLALFEECGNSADMFKKLRDIDFKRRTVTETDYRRHVEEEYINPVREHVQNEFNRVLVSGCNIDNQVFQKHGGQNTLAQEFMVAGLPVRPANKRSIDSTVEMVRRLFDARKLVFFNTCYKVREDHVAWSYKSGPDMTVADVDKYDHTNSHGADCVRYGVLLNPVHNPAGMEYAA